MIISGRVPWWLDSSPPPYARRRPAEKFVSWTFERLLASISLLDKRLWSISGSWTFPMRTLSKRRLQLPGLPVTESQKRSQSFIQLRIYDSLSTRHFLSPLSSRVNVQGVQNVLNAAREAGVTVFISTSSGSIGIRRLRLWRWPWEWFEETLPDLVQPLDDGINVPLEHGYFFSNYAYTKRLGEALVRSADKIPTGPQTSSNRKVMRTGCLRPGNGVFGPGGDVLCGAYLVRRNNPSWIHHVVQNFIYVENCSLAHLCYEARLVEFGNPTGGPRNPDIGGSAFTIADPNPPPSYGDVYNALSTLTAGRTTFPHMSPTFMLIIAHIIEIIYLSRRILEQSDLPFLARLLPKIDGDVVNMQPSLFRLVVPHLIFSSRRACLPPSEGGLGYTGQWTTLEGLCKLVEEFEASGGKGRGKADTRRRELRLWRTRIWVGEGGEERR